MTDPMKPRRVEQNIQRAVFQHLRARAAPGVFYFHCPNGGWRSKIEAAIFRGLGVVPGIPDVLALKDGRLFALELKADRGRLTPVQATAHVLLRQAGATINTAVGLDAAIRQLETWGLLRGKAI
jgi:hypothetical protein